MKFPRNISLRAIVHFLVPRSWFALGLILVIIIGGFIAARLHSGTNWIVIKRNLTYFSITMAGKPYQVKEGVLSFNYHPTTKQIEIHGSYKNYSPEIMYVHIHPSSTPRVRNGSKSTSFKFGDDQIDVYLNPSFDQSKQMFQFARPWLIRNTKPWAGTVFVIEASTGKDITQRIVEDFDGPSLLIARNLDYELNPCPFIYCGSITLFGTEYSVILEDIILDRDWINSPIQEIRIKNNSTTINPREDDYMIIPLWGFLLYQQTDQ